MDMTVLPAWPCAAKCCGYVTDCALMHSCLGSELSQLCVSVTTYQCATSQHL